MSLRPKIQLFVCFAKQEAETPSQEAALLLHRRGFDCGSTPDVPLQCTWGAHEEVTCIEKGTGTFNEGLPSLTDDVFIPSPETEFGFVLQVNLDDLFSPLQFRCVRRSGLTLLRQDDEPEQPSRLMRLRAMEISAFRVELN